MVPITMVKVPSNHAGMNHMFVYSIGQNAKL